MDRTPKKPTLFISYSHKDEHWKDRLATHLKVLDKDGLLDVWDDRRILGGDNWFREIKEAMEASSIALLLISADFLSSDFILTHEVQDLLQQHLSAKGVRV